MSCPDPSMHKKGEKCPYKTYLVSEMNLRKESENDY